jgi:hypothetical protein
VPAVVRDAAYGNAKADVRVQAENVSFDHADERRALILIVKCNFALVRATQMYFFLRLETGRDAALE